MDAARRGASALEEGNIADAVREYTTALSSNPQAIAYYIQRSIAYARSKPPDHASGLSDAETAVVLAHRRGKAELIAQAQMRRAVSLYGLGRFADCRACLDWSEARNKSDKSIPIWRMKVEDKLKGLSMESAMGGGEEQEKAAVKGRELTVVEVPEVDVDARAKEIVTSSTPPASSATITTSGAAAAPPAFTPANKIRHDWYQNNETVTVSLLAKGVPKDDSTSVDLQPGSLSISFPLPTGSDFDFSLDPLWAAIVPAESRYKVMSTKVEFVLRKAVQGQKWPSLEASAKTGGTKGLEGAAASSSTTTDPSNEAARRAALGQATSAGSAAKVSGPAYPTSSRTGPKDWDKVVSDLSKKKKEPSSSLSSTAAAAASGGGNNGKPSASGSGGADGADDDNLLDDDDDEGGDEVNSFFKKLYRNADADTRRAMMKSYTESAGTALSTNWGEVEKKTYDVVPPDGMEAKKWEQ